MSQTINQIVDKALRTGRVRDGLVLCENCDNPASKSDSLELSWTGCAPCIYGDSDMFNPEDTIRVST